jgi:type VI secretion system protein ImpL
MLSNIIRSELGKKLIYLGLWGAGLASISMMIWTLGPLISIGGWRPFENYLIRDATILIIMAAAAGGIGWNFYRRRKSSEQLAEGIGAAAKDESDAIVLKDKMKRRWPRSRGSGAAATASTTSRGT